MASDLLRCWCRHFSRLISNHNLCLRRIRHQHYCAYQLVEILFHIDVKLGLEWSHAVTNEGIPFLGLRIVINGLWSVTNVNHGRNQEFDLTEAKLKGKGTSCADAIHQSQF